MVRTEHEEQREVVQWFRQTWPGVVIFAIPNGGARGLAAAARLKAEGVLRGVPDLCIPEWMLWVEMKRQQGGVTTKEQKDMLLYLRRVGYGAIVCAGADEAKAAISAHATSLGVTNGKKCVRDGEDDAGGSKAS